MRSISFKSHDHTACIDTTIQAVKDNCEKNKLQLTPIRCRVLEIMLQEHRAWGAYEILDRLRDEGHSAQPPIAYRALDFLVKNSFAHKIEQLNAFIACSHPGRPHAPVFMICRSCDTIAEDHNTPTKGPMEASAAAAGFLIERTIVEAVGLCPNCQEQQIS